MLTYGPESRFDGVLFAPAFEAVAPELTTFVADDVFGFGLGIVDCLVEEYLDLI